ncbi:endonuclease MutS2 [Clostridium sp. 'deep sea']|uniref:endonuclease MutS2 n=1 Tax=Clostridium sp. 'deep sea' TaxID=2779445 RepID=UPI00189686C1|nr:endonuclease MutS2 [Clostridium sp. 'deep sea']QOR35630.1 endonuclease MutS2 [Clostridium sp. 'deep sea']
MDKKSINTLEFYKIKNKLSEYAFSVMAKNLIENLEIYKDIEIVKYQQKATSEARFLISTDKFTLRGLKDCRPTLERARINAVPSIEGLLNMSSTLKCFAFALKVIRRNNDKAPLMNELTVGIDELKFIAKDIDRCIDESGFILDSASSMLGEIRRQIRRIESQVKNKLDSIVSSATLSKYLQEKLVTMRQNRYVVPVKYECRQQVPGIIHDKSASGSTLFIEPMAVVELNNKLRMWEQKEQKEIERILRELGDVLYSYYEDLGTIIDLCIVLDILYARGQLSLYMGGVEPKINNNQYINLKQARHPLIPRKEVVPIDVELGEEFQALVITGPNTGGKTVTLKLVGLLQLMAQAGLHIPANINSEVSIFNNILADIGDEQSIEQSLSTFSSHMTNIIRLLDEADDKSLVLFDELGAGTDPVEGAALAMSIIDELILNGTYVIATTHYSELKAYAYNHHKITNGSVEFDVETLRPTYRLLIGVPGRSNALLIAKRLGLQQEVINGATKYISSEEKHVENMISELEDNRKKAENAYLEADKIRLQNKKLHEKYQQKVAKLQEREKEHKQKAIDDAKQYTKNVKRELDELIANLRAEFANIKDRSDLEESIKVTRQLLGEVEINIHEDDKKIVNKKQLPPKKVKKSTTGEIKKDMHVRHLQWNREGVVVSEINDKKQVQVQFGSMKMWVDVNILDEIQKPQKKSSGVIITRNQSVKIGLELDIRGKTISEAEQEIDLYLDKAILDGRKEVGIIHGKGTGALRKGVREYLQNHPQVVTMRYGVAAEGGYGITIVELNK